jgi:glycosyltransferase involved in cell wall biosynthesis
LILSSNSSVGAAAVRSALRPLRILYVEPVGDSRGHEGEFTTRLCQSLAAAGHDVVVCTNRLHPDRYLAEKALFRVVQAGGGRFGFEHVASDVSRAPGRFAGAFLRNSVMVMREALRLVRREQFDVVYVIDTDRVVMTVLLRLARLTGTALPPVVVEIHASNFSFRDYPGGLARRGWKWLQQQLMRSSLGTEISAIHTIGEVQAAGLRTQLAIDESRCPVHVITDGVDLPRPVSKGDARQRLGIDVGDGRMLLMFGTLRRDKGLENAISALREVKGKCTLVLAGNPVDYEPADIDGLIAAAGVEQRVLPRIGFASEEEMFLYFQAADAAIFPYRSFYTGGTGPLRKACACACPVVVTDVSDMGRLVREQGCGIVVPGEDVGALAAGLDRVLALRDDELARLGARGFDFAAANTWDAMADTLAAVFHDMSARGHT